MYRGTYVCVLTAPFVSPVSLSDHAGLYLNLTPPPLLADRTACPFPILLSSLTHSLTQSRSLVSGADRDDNLVLNLDFLSNTYSHLYSRPAPVIHLTLVNYGGYYQPVGYSPNIPRPGDVHSLPRRYIIRLPRA